MQFLVVAKDGTDDGALERRKQTRPTHLESIHRSSTVGTCWSVARS